MSAWMFLLIATALGAGFAVHMFGQGLWYMAVAEQSWDIERVKPERYYTRHRVEGRIVAFVIAPAITVTMLVGLWDYLP